ncbi:MAG: hypothetical protein ACE5F9_08100 [Phycisphaerae bacterium]
MTTRKLWAASLYGSVFLLAGCLKPTGEANGRPHEPRSPLVLIQVHPSPRLVATGFLPRVLAAVWGDGTIVRSSPEGKQPEWYSRGRFTTEQRAELRRTIDASGIESVAPSRRVAPDAAHLSVSLRAGGKTRTWAFSPGLDARALAIHEKLLSLETPDAETIDAAEFDRYVDLWRGRD